jgi:hypothetical protein
MSGLRQRQPRVRCDAFLAFVRSKACCACGAPPRSQAAHVRMGSRAHRKRGTGIGEKPDDRWSVPLCAGCHVDDVGALHNLGEEMFWAAHRVDPFEMAESLWTEFVAERGEPKPRRRPVESRRPPETAVSESAAQARRPERKLSTRCRSWPMCSCGYSQGRKRQVDCLRPKRKIQSRGFPPKGSRKVANRRKT